MGFFEINFWSARTRTMVSPDRGSSLPPTSKAGEDAREPAGQTGYSAKEIIGGFRLKRRRAGVRKLPEKIFKNKTARSSLKRESVILSNESKQVYSISVFASSA
ncbi:MAG: hypothetical protein IJF84_00740 [Thermoguttaceae bacterium]|nr:hypothetical protein [Thermoguttaceae bacterium]